MNKPQNPDPLYRPLPLDLSIRLVELRPGTETPVSCRLLPTTLEDPNIKYEALSYVWGDPAETIPILLNGQEYQVTVNLESALRYLRKESEVRLLWVDAICINQRDLSERSHQVSIMREIYQRCHNCLMWIGAGSEFIGLGMEVAKKLWTIELQIGEYHPPFFHKGRERSIEDSSSSSKSDSESANTPPKTKKQQITIPEYKALKALFERPAIWNRVWIMQEASLSPSVTLISGHNTLSWSTLTNFLKKDWFPDAYHKHYGHSITPIAEIFRMAQVIHHQRLLLQSPAFSTTTKFLDIIARFRPTSSTDPRDKIYGLLGLTPNTLGIIPDYTKSTSEVYTSFSLTHINHDLNLDLICQSQWKTLPHPNELNLPTWVPDFSSQYFHPLLFAQRGIFSAGRPTISKPCILTPTGKLILSGIKIGTIKTQKTPGYEEISEKWDPTTSVSFQEYVFKAWLPSQFIAITQTASKDETKNEIIITSTPSSPPSSKPEDKTRAPIAELDNYEAYWRTMMIDCTLLPNARLTTTTFLTHKRLFDSWLSGQGWDSQLIDSLTAVDIYDWAFTILDNGLFCRVSTNAVEGDLIAVLDGGKVPVTLRPLPLETKDGVAEEEVGYELIGPAYVHGIMDGEAIDWVKEGKLGFQTQDFALV